jgi:hypothetical protein
MKKYINTCLCFLLCCAHEHHKASDEEKKEAKEALIKYDMLTDEESRRRF